MRYWSWILGFVGGLGVIAFLVLAAFVDTFEPPYAIGGGVSLALLAAWLILDRDSLEAAMRARGARYSATSALLVLVAAGVAVALNVLAVRYDKRADLTSSQRFALSAQSQEVVGRLADEVEVLAFFTTGSPEKSRFQDLARSYEALGGKLRFRFHDPVREPLLAEQNKITSAWGTVIVKSGGQEQRLEEGFDEEALTNALVRLASGKRHQLCVVTGHDELDPEDGQQVTGMGQAIRRLTALNYDLRIVNLARDGAGTQGCDLLLMADPQSEPFAFEREQIAAFVAGGGAFLLLLDPAHAPELARDMARYGLKLGEDIVVEQNPRYQLSGGDPTWLILDRDSFSPHPMFSERLGMVLLRVARSVGTGAEVPGVTTQVLARTTASGWAETTLDGLTMPQPDGADIIGSVPLIALAEVKDPAGIPVGSRRMGAQGDSPEPEVERKAGGRVLVFGDSDFVSNELVNQGNNQDLLLNAIAWMLGEQEQITIRPNPAATATLNMSLLQGLGVWLICLLAVPGLAVGMALSTWRARRRL